MLAHQDTEEHNFIEDTAIVKLTRDELGELPSAMRVVGAPPCHFKYGPMPGASVENVPAKRRKKCCCDRA